MKIKWKHHYCEDPYRRRMLPELENWKIPEGDTNICIMHEKHSKTTHFTLNR